MYNFLAPIDSHDFRWPFEGSGSIPTSSRTGSVTLHRSNKFTSTTGFVGTYSGNQTGTQLFYIFRNPLRASVMLNRISSPSTYNILFDYGSLTSTTYTVNPNTDPPAPVVYAVAQSTTNAPHGQFFFPGYVKSAQGFYFFWFGANDSLVVTVTGTSPSWALFLYRVDRPGFLNTGTSPANVPTISTSTSPTTFTPATLGGSPGYYAFAVGSSGSNPFTVSAQIVVAAGDVLCHSSVPDPLTHSNYFAQVRLLSSSFLLSNVASPLNQEGIVLGAVVTDGTPFYELNSADTISQRIDYYTGPMRTGIYCWLRPDERAFNWRDAITRDEDGRIIEAVFDLDDGCTYNAIATNANGDTSGNFPALDYILTYAWTLEFRTDDIWRELEFPKYSQALATEALAMVLRAPSFTENPLHIRVLTNFIKNVVGGFRKHSRVLGNALAVAFPQYGTSLRLAGQLLQS